MVNKTRGLQSVAAFLAVIGLLGFGTARAAPFEIGVALPLSGSNSDFGTAGRNGLALACADMPEVCSAIRYRYEDHEYDAKRTLGTYHKLHFTDKVDLLFVWGSQPCLAVAPIAERDRAPLICFSGDPKPNLRYVFSFNSPASDYAKPLADYLLQNQHSRWGLLQADMPFLQRVATELKSQTAAVRPPSIEQTVLPDTQDFRSEILSLKSKELSTLVVLLLPPQIAPFIKQAAAAGLKVQLLGTDTFSSIQAIKESNGLMEGALYAEMAVNKDFERRYRERFGNGDNLSFAANMYDFAFFARELFGKLPHGAPAADILQRLSIAGGREGRVTGPFQYVDDDKQGQFFRFKIGLRRVKGLDWENANDDG